MTDINLFAQKETMNSNETTSRMYSDQRSVVSIEFKALSNTVLVQNMRCLVPQMFYK